MPSKSLYWHTFGSLANALREAGFDVAVGEERLERAVEQGAELARSARASAEVRRLGGRPARAAAEPMLTEWQVYRMFESRRGAWATFQFLVRAAAARGGRGRRLRTARWLRLGRSGDRREPREAELALLRRAHGRQRVVLDERAAARNRVAAAPPCPPQSETSVPSRSSRLRS